MRTKKKFYLFGIFIFFVLLVFISCASTSMITEKLDLCGIIVDEHNNPVNNCLVSCKRKSKNTKEEESRIEKMINPTYTTFTNESGIFVFHGVSKEMYLISAQKTGYVPLKETEYSFVDRTELFCCQIQEINSVLDEVERMITLKEYEKGKNLLDEVYVEKNTNEEKVILYYKHHLEKMVINENGETNEGSEKSENEK